MTFKELLTQSEGQKVQISIVGETGKWRKVTILKVYEDCLEYTQHGLNKYYVQLDKIIEFQL